MKRNCGWVQVIDPESEQVVARGRVLVADRPGVAFEGRLRADWEGDLDLLRVAEPAAIGTDRTYLVWFEEGHEQRLVSMGELRPQMAPSGPRALARISSADSELPSLVRELGGEE